MGGEHAGKEIEMEKTLVATESGRTYVYGIIIIAILLAGFVLLLRQAGRARHPLLQSLRSRGIRPGATELLLCSRPSFVSAGRLMTERSSAFCAGWTG
ncbi:hypothetical protein CV83915_3p0083 (plasmid) [Escherichia coli]|uniref:Uncharacterized protein n=1 Tax=Escherichia coli TaxID=562 RepID=A0A2H4TLF3_ECOLX|nr:hypothetical protein CV83915_3p0083 [Escherichia coli]